MGHGRGRALALLVGAMTLGLAASAGAEVPDSPDVFNQQTFNTISGGSEVGFAASQTVSRTYDTTAYTYAPGQETQERARSGCGGGSSFAFGDRTAWMRFVPAVKGKLVVTASSGYNVILFAYRSPLPRGSGPDFSESALITLNCNDASTGGNEINMPVPSSVVVPGEAILLETASFCGIGAASCPTTPSTGRPGGPTTLTVTFTADDADGDGVPDTLDACPSASGPAPGGCPPSTTDGDGDGIHVPADQCPSTPGIAPDGCPDSDGDGRSDRVDKCPQQFGRAASGCLKRLDASVSILYNAFANYTKLVKLNVTAATGTRVAFRCQGRDCRTKRATFTLGTKRRSLKGYVARSGRLRPGTVVEVRATLRGTLGTYRKLRFRAGKPPKVSRGCISPNGRVTKCP
jgi:hypothetical protein